MKSISRKLRLSFVAATLTAIASFSVTASAASYGMTAPIRTDNSIKLDWEAQDGADAYKVYISDEETGKLLPFKIYATDFCTIDELAPDTKYKFKVAALSQNEEGKYDQISCSGVVTVSTKPVVMKQEATPQPEVKVDVIADLKKQLSEAKSKLSSVQKDIDACKKRIANNDKIIKQYQGAASNSETGVKVAIARQEIEEDTRLLNSLELERSKWTATVNRLTTNLHSRGCRDV